MVTSTLQKATHRPGYDQLSEGHTHGRQPQGPARTINSLQRSRLLRQITLLVVHITPPHLNQVGDHRLRGVHALPEELVIHLAGTAAACNNIRATDFVRLEEERESSSLSVRPLQGPATVHWPRAANTEGEPATEYQKSNLKSTTAEQS